MKLAVKIRCRIFFRIFTLDDNFNVLAILIGFIGQVND